MNSYGKKRNSYVIGKECRGLRTGISRKKDLLICGGKIECIQDSIGELPVECEILDAEGKILTPGF